MVEKSATEVTVPATKASNSLHEDSFEDAETLLDFVTANWRQRWVTTDVWDDAVAEIFTRRPFFLLISVDAPLTARWQRFRIRYMIVRVQTWVSIV